MEAGRSLHRAVCHFVLRLHLAEVEELLLNNGIDFDVDEVTFL